MAQFQFLSFSFRAVSLRPESGERGIILNPQSIETAWLKRLPGIPPVEGRRSLGSSRWIPRSSDVRRVSDRCRW